MGICSNPGSNAPSTNFKYHNVLCCAQRSKHLDTYDLDIYDSCRGLIDFNVICRFARKHIRSYPILGLNKLSEAIPVTVEPSARYLGSSPQCTGDLSGLHTILNTWALLLELPLTDAAIASYDATQDTFGSNAQAMINLALAGRIDSKTIAGFLVDIGYFHRWTNDSVPHVQLARMPVKKYVETLAVQGQRDHAAMLERTRLPPNPAELTNIHEYAKRHGEDVRRHVEAWYLGTYASDGQPEDLRGLFDDEDVSCPISRGFD